MRELATGVTAELTQVGREPKKEKLLTGWGWRQYP